MLQSRSPGRRAARLSAVLVAALFALPLTATGALATDPEPCEVEDLRLTYTVDGEVVDGLEDKVEPGDEVVVHVAPDDDCRDVELTLASYQATAATFNEDQVRYQYQTDDFDSGRRGYLKVHVPDCYFQVDLAFGEVITSFKGGVRYDQRLISADLGGTTACGPHAPPPPETVTPPSAPPPPPETVTPPSAPQPPPETVTPLPPSSPEAPIVVPALQPPPAPPAASPPAADSGGTKVETTTPTARANLASTGFATPVLALLAMATLGAGAVLVWTTRKRATD